MALSYAKIQGLPLVPELSGDLQVMVHTGNVFYNTKLSALAEHITRQLGDDVAAMDLRVTDIDERLDAIELAPGQPSIWPEARSITLGGMLSGTVSVDGSKDVTINATAVNQSIPQSAILYLQDDLSELQTSKAERDHNHRVSIGEVMGPISSMPLGPTAAASTGEAPPPNATVFNLNAGGDSVAQMAFGQNSGEVYWRSYGEDAFGPWLKFSMDGSVDLSNYVQKNTSAQFTDLNIRSAAGASTLIDMDFLDKDGGRVGSLVYNLADKSLSLQRLTNGTVTDQLRLTDTGLMYGDNQVWHSGTFAPGNKLDIGTAAADYMGSSTTEFGPLVGVDVDTLTPGVRAYVARENTNTPPGTSAYYYIETLKIGQGSDRLQRAWAATEGEMFVRTRTSNVWSTWRREWDSVNFDPASKLNANAAAVSAARLTTARNFSLSGVITASAVAFSGTGNVTLNTTIADGALSIAKTNGLQTALDGLQTAINAKVSPDSPSFTGTMSMAGDIIPDLDNTRTLGSPTRMWKDVFIGPGSLYLNGQKVLEDTQSGTIRVTADAGQNIAVQTYGAGDIELAPLGTGLIQLKGNVSFLGGSKIRSSNGQAFLFDDDFSFTPGTGIVGGLKVTGGAVTIDGQTAWHGGNFDPSTKLNVTATAAAASKLATARTITLGGLLSGSVAFDGSSNATLTAAMADGALTIAKVAGLQEVLDSKATGGGFGLGVGVKDFDWASTNRASRFAAGTTGSPETGKNYMGIRTVLDHTDFYALNIAGRNNKLWFQTVENGTTQAWNEVYHTGNLSIADYAKKTDAAPSAAKWTTPRNFYYQGDFTGNVAIDGSQDIGAVGRLRAYQHGGTGNQYAGQYVRIASATLSALYEDAAIAFRMMGYGDGATYGRTAVVRFRIKQQVALPGLPYVNVDIESANYLNPEDFYAVISDTTSYPIKVDLYTKMSGTYSGLKSSVIARGGSRTVELIEGDGYVATLPAGTVVQGIADASRNYAASYTARDGMTIAGNEVWHAGSLNKASFHQLDVASVGDLSFAGNANGRGVKFWGATDNYKFYMSQSTDTTFGGRIDGETKSDYNLHFRMGSTVAQNRGFVFESAYGSKLFGIHPDGVRSSVGVQAPTLGALNPNNTNASVVLSWQANVPRIRIGGTGTGAGATFRIQGESDFTRMSLDAAGNMVVPGYMDAKNTLNRVILPSTTTAAKWLKIGTATWPGNNARYLQFEAASGNLGARRMARDFVTVNNRGYTSTTLALTQAIVNSIVDHQRIRQTDTGSDFLQVGLVLLGTASASTGVEIWIKVGLYNSGMPLTLINNDNITWEARDNALVDTEPTGIVYATAYDILSSRDLETNTTWKGAQYFEAPNTHFGSKSVADTILEIGGRVGIAKSAGLDFHTSGGDNDFDSRILATGGDGTTNGAGKLTASASEFAFTGNITLNGSKSINFGGGSTIIRDAGSAGMVIATAAGGAIYLRPNGDASTANQLTINAANVSYNGNVVYHAGNFNPDGKVERGTGSVLNADGTAPAAFFTDVANQLALKYSNNTTGSTGYPTEFGATLSVIMGRQNSRSFDFHMPTNSPNFLYYRGYGSTGTPTEWKTIASPSHSHTWQALQTFNAGWSMGNNILANLGTGGGALRGTSTGSVVLSAGTGANGYVYLRPNGDASTVGQAALYANGVMELTSIKTGMGVGDGGVMLELAGERPWQFRQLGVGATSALELYDTIGGKDFKITGLNGSGTIMFSPYNGTITATTFSGKLTGNADTATTATGFSDGTGPSSFLRRDAANGADVRLSSGDGRGLRFWDNDQYKIFMSAAATAGTGGRIAGETTSDYNMYFRMSSGTNRGFVFETTNAAKLLGIHPNGVRSAVNVTAPTFIGALTGNADTATKLATARNINGVPFDGSQNITITAQATIPDSPTITGNVTFTGPVTNTSGSFRAQGWGGTATNGVLYLGSSDSYVYKSGGVFSFKNAEGGYTANLDSGGTIHTTGNFNPATKLDARAALGVGAASHADWNTATNNGWWMAAGAANAPGGSTDWFLGVVTVHNGDWIQQEIYRFTEGGTVAGAKWYRWKKGGTWGAWTQDLVVGGTLTANRLVAGWDSGVGGSMSCNNWFRSSGQTGWFSNDYGGGIYMTDTTYVQVYNGKAMKAAWFEVNGPVHNPQQYASAAAFRAYGNYGGGYGLIDGNAHISMYSVGGHLNFGFGQGAVAGKASIQSDGTFYGYDFAINSDRTMKKNIRPFRYNGRLRPVNFRWKADGSCDIGFIAQEVQKQYPEAVKLDEQTGKLRLTQSKLTAVVAHQVNAVEDEVIKLKAHVKRRDRQLAQALKSIKTLQRQVAKLMKK
jgi:hypothetical protein